MFEGLTRRDVVIAAIVLSAVIALAVEGNYYGLHRYVLDSPAGTPAQQDDLKPNRQAD
ncbi:MAG: hypothetical protein WDN50_09845 [Bradyrhizobium sp.]